MTAPLRVFIAIEIPDLVCDAIRAQIDLLGAVLPETLVRWTADDNLHLTLKFLGDVPPNRVDTVAKSLMQTAAKTTRFALHVGGFGSFPTPKRPRVIWAGVRPPADLVDLQEGVESALLKLGFAGEERPFVPHLTIGRVKQPVSPKDQEALSAALEKAHIGDLGIIEVDSVHLYKSDLRAGGSLYTKLASAPLKS